MLGARGLWWMLEAHVLSSFQVCSHTLIDVLVCHLRVSHTGTAIRWCVWSFRPITFHDIEEEHINASYTDGQQSQDHTK
jgi:hypothetical protein